MVFYNVLREIVKLTETVLNFYNDPVHGGIHFALQIIVIAQVVRRSTEGSGNGYPLRITNDSGLFQSIRDQCLAIIPEEELQCL